jgi:outer membrane protein OmpA-like peptidoglycan-associated protein
MRSFHTIFTILLTIILTHLKTFYAQAQQRQHDTVTIYYPFDKFDIKGEYAHRLNRFVHESSFSGKKIDSILITGHTDTSGTIAYNMQLSLRRARSAGNYIDNMIAPALHPFMKIAGSGKNEIIEGGDSLNRRAVIIFCYMVKAAPTVTGSGDDIGTDNPFLTDTVKTSQANISKASFAEIIKRGTPPDTVITLKNIYFIEDKPILTGSSRFVLPGYVNLLKRYKGRFLEIDGFCNSPTPIYGPDDPLFILSVKRAKFIYDTLIDEGFDPDKLSYKGMGNSSPANPDAVTLDQKRANMRVEIKVY